MQKLAGKVAVVTGAAQGIGCSIADEMANAGAQVAVVDLDEEASIAAAERIAIKTKSRTMGIRIDVADRDSILLGLKRICSELGPPDILVNNAGLYRGTPISDTKYETWKLLLDVMLTGPFLLSQAVVPAMIKKEWGRIINLGSLASVMGFGEDAAYCAAKSGVIGLTHALAAELAKYRICVNAICPGNVDTRLMRETGAAIEKREGLESGQFMRERAASIPLGRLGDPADIAQLAVFLSSEQGNYITGQTIHVNGGLYQT